MNLGTIEELPSGKVSIRLPRSVDPKRRRLGPFNSREEAKGVVNASLALAQEGQLTIPEGQTLRGFAAFLDRRELRGLRDTGNARNLAKNHIEGAAFIDWPLTSIKRVHIRDWLDHLQRKRSPRRKARLGCQTVVNILNLMRALFNDALERGTIETNPVRDVKLHRSAFARSDEPWTYLTVIEQAALLAAVPIEEQPLVAFAMWTGIRKSELWQLRLADVHADGDAPHVVIRFSRKGLPTKNGKIHKVPLFGAALDAVKAQLEGLKGKPNHRACYSLPPEEKFEKRSPAIGSNGCRQLALHVGLDGTTCDTRLLHPSCAVGAVDTVGQWLKFRHLSAISTPLPRADTPILQTMLCAKLWL